MRFPNISVAATLAGLLLLGVNGYGVLLGELRPEVVATYVDFAGVTTMPADQALGRLTELESEPVATRLEAATRVIHAGIAHVDPVDRVRIGSRELHAYVPVWENFILFALRFVFPETYLDYEFCRFDKAVERGFGRCGQQSLALVDFLSKTGVKTGFVNLGGHTLVTAETEPGSWVLLDPDFGGVLPMNLEVAEQAGRTIEQHYWHEAATERELWRLFASRDNEIFVGGVEARWGRACQIEALAYVLKWVLPLVLVAIGVWLRRFGRSS